MGPEKTLLIGAQLASGLDPLASGMGVLGLKKSSSAGGETLPPFITKHK